MSESASNYYKQYVAVRDGVELLTHVHLPAAKGKWPVLFGRTPYPQLVPLLQASAKTWNEHGYVFVIQECRGTGGSRGKWEPFINERNDGLDSIDWIIAQQWMNGAMATIGSSYCGTLQWAMSDQLPPEVKTMFISFTGIERYVQNYMNGMFRHDIYTVWALGNSGIELSLKERERLYERSLAVKPHIEMDKLLFGQQLPWYRDWVSHVSADDHYWKEGFWFDLSKRPLGMEIPILLVGGWFDHNLEATYLSYSKLPRHIREQSACIIGPWVHTEDVAGDLSFPNHDLFGKRQIKAALEWFDAHLKGERKNTINGLHTYIVGDGTWSQHTNLLKASSWKHYYLSAKPSVEVEAAYCLFDEPQLDEGKLSYCYDSANPVPTLGGSGLMNYLSGDEKAARPASVLQRPIGERDDVLSFVSEPFEHEMFINGRIEIRLSVASDAADTSFCVTIMEMFKDGRAFNIRDGVSSLRYRNGDGIAINYRPDSIVTVTIECWPITWKLQQASRLRVDVTSSNFPAYHIHRNTAELWSRQAIDIVAEQKLITGSQHISVIKLPLA